MTDLIEDLDTPSAEPGTGHVPVGTGTPRVEGRAKVTGAARYSAEYPSADLVYGVVVNSTIARGRVTGFDLDAARAVPGVIDILTHDHRPKMRGLNLAYREMATPPGTVYKPLYDDEVRCNGQPVALVLADTFEAARHAAQQVVVHYHAQPHQTDLHANLQHARDPKRPQMVYKKVPDKGNPDTAYAAAPNKVDLRFEAGVEHHNPMELFASTVIRDSDGHFTIYDKTQSSQFNRWYVSRVFGLSKSKVTVRNAYVGGAFGGATRAQYQLPLAVLASIHLERSVRVVLTRQQMFTLGFRPGSVQQVKLAAGDDGRLYSIWQEAVAETSRFEDYADSTVSWAGRLYACDNIHQGHQIVELDRFTPIDMRAPGATHGMFALEVAMDELAYAVGIDPLELRLKNYAERTPIDDKPYSSKALRECYRLGAERFGWATRPPQPRARKEGTEYIGWGMATGAWDALHMFARASAVLHTDGRLVVSCAATDLGTGTATAMAMIAADALGLPLEQVTFQLGDSTLPIGMIAGGSAHAATVGSAVDATCEKLRKQLLKLAQALPDSVYKHAKLGEVRFIDGGLQLGDDRAGAITYADLLAAAGEDRVEVKSKALPNMKQRKFACMTHSAVFCEVHVDEELGTVRVTRVVSAIAAGRIINPTTARSQIVGGVIWGIGQALHEESQGDHRFGKFMNHDFAGYHIPTNADIHDIDVLFADEDDRIVSRIGAKGVGEIGIVGVAAAVCNAIYHATGQRVRSTPITPDKVMMP